MSEYTNYEISDLGITLQHLNDSNKDIYPNIESCLNLLISYIKKYKYQKYYDIIAQNISEDTNKTNSKNYYNNLINKKYGDEDVSDEIIDNDKLTEEKEYWCYLPAIISYGGLFNLKLTTKNVSRPSVQEDEYETFDVEEQGTTYYKLTSDSKIISFINQFNITATFSTTTADSTTFKTSDLNLSTILTQGYFEYKKEKFYLFNTANNLIGFIESLITNKNPSIETSFFTFNASISKTINTIIKEKILECLQGYINENVTFYTTNNTYLNGDIKDDSNSKVLVQYVSNVQNPDDDDIATFYFNRLNNLFARYKEIAKQKYDSMDTSLSIAEREDMIGDFRKEMKGLESILTSKEISILDTKLIMQNIPSSININETLNKAGVSSLSLNQVVKNQTKKISSIVIFNNKKDAESFINNNKEDLEDTFAKKLPLMFYEHYLKGDISGKEYQDILNTTGEGIVPKLVFNSAYFLAHSSTQYINNNNSTNNFQVQSKWSLSKKLEDWGIKINGQIYKCITKESNGFKTLTDAVKDLTSYIKTAIDKLWDSFYKKIEEESIENVAPDAGDWNTAVSQKLSVSYTPQDFFFIENVSGKKKIPTDKFVVAQFNIPKWDKEAEQYVATWVDITSKKNYRSINKNNRDYKADDAIPLSKNFQGSDTNAYSGDYILPGDYFKSFTLTDGGDGGKTLEMTLESPNDSNLENIIMASLSVEHMTKAVDNTNSNDVIDMIFSSSTNALSSNFRLKFGYLDQETDTAKNKAIRAKEADDQEFITRTESVNPVLYYPWTYFKITDISSQMFNDTLTYTIKACESSQYILNELCLTGDKSLNFNESDDNGQINDKIGRTKNVIGKIAGYLYEASNKRICVLGSDSAGDNRILTGYDVEQKKYEQDVKYELKSGVTLKFSQLDDIGDYFYIRESEDADIPDKRTFNVVSDKSANIVSIKDLLDSLCAYEPPVEYMLAKDEDGTVKALKYKYDDISSLNMSVDEFYETIPVVTKSLKYQTFVCDAKIDNAEKWSKVCFIRFYYDGPSNTGTKNNNNYIRIYNYTGTKDQVITNLSLNNGGPTLANYQAGVTVIGNGGDALTFNYIRKDTAAEVQKSSIVGIQETDKISTTATTNGSIKSGDKRIVSKSIATINHSTTSSNDTTADDTSKATEGVCFAANVFTKLAEQAYTGELTIYGDPFYYFDTSVEPGVYEIYLNVDKQRSPIDTRSSKSYFSGVYYIKGITHEFNSSGDYTTKLDIVKETFGATSKVLS